MIDKLLNKQDNYSSGKVSKKALPAFAGAGSGEAHHSKHPWSEAQLNPEEGGVYRHTPQ
jgi:hypothetical protein